MAAPARSVLPQSRPNRPRGLRTRRAILGKAVALASLEGLEALSIGRLASTLRMSKSGLFAHFGSKEELQCSAVAAARAIFVNAVIRPAEGLRGLRRLRAYCQRWLGYTLRREFPGGCFFTAASLEFDDRPGRVRERIVESMREWLAVLEATVREAQEDGELAPGVDPRAVSFEIHSLAMGANWRNRLFQDPGALRMARHAIFARIDQLAATGRRRR